MWAQTDASDFKTPVSDETTVTPHFFQFTCICHFFIVCSNDMRIHILSASFCVVLQSSLFNSKFSKYYAVCSHTLLLLLRPFNSIFFRTTWVSWRQKGKPFWILLEQEKMGQQWHQLDHMQIICISLQTDNQVSTSPLSFYRPEALPAVQPTASKH